jgi:hypothetical protein
VKKLCFNFGGVFPVGLLRLDRYGPGQTHSEDEEQSFEFSHYELFVLFRG